MFSRHAEVTRTHAQLRDVEVTRVQLRSIRNQTTSGSVSLSSCDAFLARMDTRSVNRIRISRGSAQRDFSRDPRNQRGSARQHVRRRFDPVKYLDTRHNVAVPSRRQRDDECIWRTR